MKLTHMQMNIIRARFSAEYSKQIDLAKKKREPFIAAKKKSLLTLKARLETENDKLTRLINKRLESMDVKVTGFEPGPDTVVGRLKAQVNALKNEIVELESFTTSWDLWPKIQFELVFAQDGKDIDALLAKALGDAFKTKVTT